MPLDEYKQFLHKAKQVLAGHEKGEDFIALCLAKSIKVWTYESLLFKIGFRLSTAEIARGLSKE